MQILKIVVFTGTCTVSLEHKVFLKKFEVQEARMREFLGKKEWIPTKCAVIEEGHRLVLKNFCSMAVIWEILTVLTNSYWRRVHSSTVTPENKELIQKSIYILIFTLKNIETWVSVMRMKQQRLRQ